MPARQVRKLTGPGHAVLVEDIVVPGSVAGTRGSDSGAVLSSKFVDGPWYQATASAFGASVKCVLEADCTTMAATPVGALHVLRPGMRSLGNSISITMGLGRC